METTMQLNSDEHYELESTVYEIVYSELTEDPLQYSSKHFYDNLTGNIAHLFYEEWNNMGLCSEDDMEYIHDIIHDMILNFFDVFEFPHRSYNTYDDCGEKNVEALETQLEYLENIPQQKQRTKEWYEARHNMLTASSVWKAFGSEAYQNSLIYEKCKPFDPASTYRAMGASVKWGNLFEPISILIYEKKFDTTIKDFGCIPHPEIPYLGASPDGINVDKNSEKYGRMLEVKNIYNRDIDGIPKEEYWIQMQMQLEVCDLEYCDFLETRFKEYETEEQLFEGTHEWRGVILYFMKPYDNDVIHKYMPLELELTPGSLESWKQSVIDEMPDDYEITRYNYWYLDEFSCVVVKRNRLWFHSAKSKIQEIWDTIQRERLEGYEHRAAKKRSNSESQISPTKIFVSTEESSSRSIHNLNIESKINLVKLDS